MNISPCFLLLDYLWTFIPWWHNTRPLVGFFLFVFFCYGLLSFPKSDTGYFVWCEFTSLLFLLKYKVSFTKKPPNRTENSGLSLLTETIKWGQLCHRGKKTTCGAASRMSFTITYLQNPPFRASPVWSHVLPKPLPQHLQNLQSVALNRLLKMAFHQWDKMNSVTKLALTSQSLTV